MVPSPASLKSLDPAVEAELERLAVMPIVQLRIRYQELFRAAPPKAFGPDLLRRSIAQRIQDKAYGGLPRPTQRLLDQLVKAARSSPAGRIEVPRRIKPGSVLVREWKKVSHRVTVLVDGFAYDGNTYSNLSEIACLITGTRWNGPRFFGLRSKTPESGEPGNVGHSSRAKRGIGASTQTSHLGGGRDYRKKNAEVAANSALEAARHGR